MDVGQRGRVDLGDGHDVADSAGVGVDQHTGGAESVRITGVGHLVARPSGSLTGLCDRPPPALASPMAIAPIATAPAATRCRTRLIVPPLESVSSSSSTSAGGERFVRRSRPIDSGHERADDSHHLRRRVLSRSRLSVVLDHVAVGHERAERASADGALAIHLAVPDQPRQGQRVRRLTSPRSAGHVQADAHAARGARTRGQRRGGQAVHGDRHRAARPSAPRGGLRRHSCVRQRMPDRRRARHRAMPITSTTNRTTRRSARRPTSGSSAPVATSGRRSSPSVPTPRPPGASSAR